MSDGPHRTLAMRPAWRRVAERADNTSFGQDEIAEAMCAALAGDWRAEVPEAVVGAVASVLGDEAQPSLLAGDARELDRLRANSGAPLAAALVDAAGDLMTEGARGRAAVEAAIGSALLDRALRECRSVEEHYLRRSTAPRGAGVRDRLEKAAARAQVRGLARDIARGLATAKRYKPAKRDGLDEGVRL